MLCTILLKKCKPVVDFFLVLISLVCLHNDWLSQRLLFSFLISGLFKSIKAQGLYVKSSIFKFYISHLRLLFFFFLSFFGVISALTPKQFPKYIRYWSRSSKDSATKLDLVRKQKQNEGTISYSFSSVESYCEPFSALNMYQWNKWWHLRPSNAFVTSSVQKCVVNSAVK